MDHFAEDASPGLPLSSECHSEVSAEVEGNAGPEESGLEIESLDSKWMMKAIEIARHAASIGEVPIAALVVFDGEMISSGYNLRESHQDPTAHAEMIAIREASKVIGSWRLIDCTLYVTLEPCPMCAGAAVNARLTRCVYGATDPKAGAASSLFSIMSDPRLNHRVDLTGGCQAESCAELLSSFFRSIREGRGKPKPTRVDSTTA